MNGPIRTVVFTSQFIEPGALRCQSADYPLVQTDNRVGAISMLIPSLGVPFAHVTGVSGVIVLGRDPYPGYSHAGLAAASGCVSFTQALQAADADAGQVVAIDVSLIDAGKTHTMYAWVVGS